MARLTHRELLALIEHRAAEVISLEHLRRKLESGKKLRVKLGVDPTTPHLHLGHIVPFRMLRAFQEAGHRAVVIIGDFTAQIGDPAEREAERRALTPAEVRENERTYSGQIGRVLDLKRAEVHHNREWFSKLNAAEFLRLLMHFPLRSAWEREDFQKRLAAGREVRLHEAMYPVLQAYDSVVVRADVELGSIDQKLNVLAGRELQRSLGVEPQEVILLSYLIGLDGRMKMSKSLPNAINLDDSAREMFGKVMSIPDHLIENYARLAAWLPPARVASIRRRLSAGANPRDLKLELAEAVTALYHGRASSRRAHEEFLAVFARREIPASAPTVRLDPGVYSPVELIRALKVAGSKSEARRLVAGGALEVNGRKVHLGDARIVIRRRAAIRVGKRKFFRVG